MKPLKNMKKRKNQKGVTVCYRGVIVTGNNLLEMRRILAAKASAVAESGVAPEFPIGSKCDQQNQSKDRDRSKQIAKKSKKRNRKR